MVKTKNILHISPDFNYSCGVSKYVFSLLKNFSQDKSYKLFFITNGGDSLERIKNIGISPTIISFSSGIKNVFNFYPNMKYLLKFCIQNKIDIIHTHHRYPEYLAYKVSEKANVKTITTVHSLVKGKYNFSFKSNRIIAVSNSVKEVLHNNYRISLQRITVLHNYLEMPEFTEQDVSPNIKPTLGITEDEKIILFIGRVIKDKGVDLLINTFKLLRKEDKKISLFIAGPVYDSSLRSSLNKSTDGIKILGVVKNPYLYYSVADLVVLPSRVDSFPYVMLEAAIMRRPFLGSRTGGIKEFIEDGVDGTLFNCGDTNELKNKIEYLLHNQNVAYSLADNLYQKVRKEFSQYNYISKLNNIYEDLLALK